MDQSDRYVRKMGAAIGDRVKDLAVRLFSEPPFRRLARSALRHLSVSPSLRQVWDACLYPQYLFGAVRAAQFARDQGRAGVTVAELGCAGGRGLLELASYAQAVSQETGLAVQVFGFDIATGLPPLCGDYRDHPDAWQTGDFPMDVDELHARLPSNTRLVLGNVRDTVPAFVSGQLEHPLGFLAFDLDLYTSTRDALRILKAPSERMLKHVVLYFDDINRSWSHHKAGEQLAVAEFNREESDVVIDVWSHARYGRPFSDAGWLDRMYLAHNLRAIEALAHTGPPNRVHALASGTFGRPR